MRGAQRGGDDFEIGIRLHGALDHVFEVFDFELREVRIGALDFEAEAGGEVFLVSDHHIHIRGELTVNFLCFGLTANRLPQGRSVVEVIRHNYSRTAGRLHRFERDVRCGLG